MSFPTNSFGGVGFSKTPSPGPRDDRAKPTFRDVEVQVWLGPPNGQMVFDAALDMARGWIATSFGVPPDLLAAASPHSDSGDAGLRVSVVNIPAPRTWSCRIDVAGPAGSTSAELALTAAPGKRCLMRVALALRRPDASPCTPAEVPALVGDVAARFGLVGPGSQNFSRGHQLVSSRSEADRLVDTLRSPRRLSPVVVSAVTLVDGQPVGGFGGAAEVDAFSRRVCGAASVVCLPEQFTFELTNAFGKQFSVWNGGVRVYLPGVDVNGDPFAHPLTTSDRISRISGGVDRLRQQTAELVIAHTAAAARTAAGAALSHAKLESLLVRAGLIREAPTRVSFAEVVAVRPELPRQTVAPAAPPPLVPTDSEQPDVAAAFERQRSVPQAAPQTFVEVKPWAALDAEQPDVDYGSGFP